jgi:hypothetical protein
MLNIKPKKNLDMGVGHKIIKCEQVDLHIKGINDLQRKFFKNNILNLI